MMKNDKQNDLPNTRISTRHQTVRLPEQGVSTCLFFILSSAKRADGVCRKLSLACATNILLIY